VTIPGAITRLGLTGQHVSILLADERQKVVAFQHWYHDQPGYDSVLVVLNFRDKAHAQFVLPVPHAGLWKVRFNSDWGAYDNGFTDFLVYDTQTEGDHIELPLPPYGAIVLSQEPL
jgi:1,4-alpha-glucan branching enzyme